MARPKVPDDQKHFKFNLSIAPDLFERVMKYCQDEERPIAWVFQKAVDAWLKERGY